MSIGFLLFLWTMVLFAKVGKGTLAPWAPPVAKNQGLETIIKLKVINRKELKPLCQIQKTLEV